MSPWNLLRWVRAAIPTAPIRRRPQRRSAVRLLLEHLEDGLAPATFTVTDNSDSTADQRSLRYALTHLDAGAAAATNTITFAPTLTGGQTITEKSADGGGLTISQGVTITGPAAGVTIDGASLFTVFTVNSGVTASLSGLTISHGSATLGGGINNLGTLTVGDSTFSANSASGVGDGDDDDARPVFVVGLPRSGTTLVEQVLASHSQVFGAGELPLMRRAMDALPRVVDRPEEMTACLAALDDAALRRPAGGYTDGVQALLGRAGRVGEPARVVDKMPDNYLYLGLIALLFPRATLVHVRRDVRDVAVSCWMTHFRSIRWADDMDDLARRIADYRRLSDHWRAVLPRPVHEVHYERLVDDFEPEARRLVAACGLEWEPACLRFHETARPVRTASVTQVRQPLYRKSLGRWKAYAPYLAPLFDRLQENAASSRVSDSAGGGGETPPLR